MAQAIFSCVVDAPPRFHLDALRWFSSLTTIAGIDPRDLVVHVVGPDTSDVLLYLRSRGVTVRPVEAFDPRSPHCNKVAGALRLARDERARSVILCDTDIAVLEDPRTIDIAPGSIGGKVVDTPVPPLEVLREIFAAAGVPAPATTPLPWGENQVTVVGNNNGGLYLIPGPLLAVLAPAWEMWARWLLDRRELLLDWTFHLDQVAMVLALTAEGIGSEQLDVRWNTPIHDLSRIPPDPPVPAVIHYHQEIDSEGRIRLTGFPSIDQQIERVNEAIGRTWQEASPTVTFGKWRARTELVPGTTSHRSEAGPWAVVVGMHRSGTSAVTGAMGALGFNVVSPQDRLSPHDSNPEHWESLSVLLHSDAVLAHFGGTWDAPPTLPEGWEHDGGLPDRNAAAAALATAYPDPGPSVWKDPRICLLLPYWRAVLQKPMAAVLVWRDPLAVARSLRSRDGMPLPYGLALWERYNRSAIANLAGTDVYVLDYDALVEDPAVSLHGLTSWMDSIGIFDGMQPWDHESALSIIAANLRHESLRRAETEDRMVLDEQRRLVDHLTQLAGAQSALPQLPGEESPWTEAILDSHRAQNVLARRNLERSLQHCEGERDWYIGALEESRSHLANLRASSSWRMTAPVRSLSQLWTGSRQRRHKA